MSFGPIAIFISALIFLKDIILTNFKGTSTSKITFFFLFSYLRLIGKIAIFANQTRAYGLIFDVG